MLLYSAVLSAVLCALYYEEATDDRHPETETSAEQQRSSSKGAKGEAGEAGSH
jgi:hypothetical protein